MKKLLWLIVCLMTIVTFTSCSSDDEDEIFTESSIVGTWQFIDTEGFYTASPCYITFKSNLKGKLSCMGATIDISYQITNDRLMIHGLNTLSYDADIAYHKARMEEISAKIKTAHGSARDALISQYNAEMQKARNIAAKKSQDKVYFYMSKKSKNQIQLRTEKNGNVLLILQKV